MGNVTAWLEKNADPVNDTVVDVLKQGGNALMVYLWREHPGQSNPPEESKDKKKKKGGSSKTVSSVYLVQLGELMSILHATEPHFIRCIVPNTHKQPLVVETELIMQQLTCNGVLEGIRVCMLGFPNRMLYPDYKSRYAILGAAEIAGSSDNKVAVRALMEKISFPAEKYQLGHTKVFFRAGALAYLEDKAKSAYGAYEEALNVTKDLEAANKAIIEETGALTKQLESEQGNLSVYTDRQAKATGVKIATEQKLEVATAALGQAELDKQAMTGDRKVMEGEIGIIKKDIEDLDLAFQKLEQEKTNRDHTIRSLTDEVSQTDEVINKLNKEKKMIGDTQAKAHDDLHVAERRLVISMT